MNRHEQFQALMKLKKGEFKVEVLKNLTIDFPLQCEGVKFDRCYFSGEEYSTLKFCSFERCKFLEKGSFLLQWCEISRSEFRKIGLNGTFNYFENCSFVDVLGCIEYTTFQYCDEIWKTTKLQRDGLFEQVYLIDEATFKKVKPEYSVCQLTESQLQGRKETGERKTFRREDIWKMR